MNVRNRFSAQLRVHPEPPVGGRGAKQSMKDECDINKIMARYIRTGTLLHVAPGVPQYGFAPEMSFQEAMNFMVRAQEDFESLPAKVRLRFNNSATEFVDFCSKRENLPELRKLGLAPEESKPAAEPASTGST